MIDSAERLAQEIQDSINHEHDEDCCCQACLLVIMVSENAINTLISALPPNMGGMVVDWLNWMAAHKDLT